MSYDKSKFTFTRVDGQSKLDVSMKLDVTTLDEAVGTYTNVPVSTFTMTEGYTIGEVGEQSIDPAAGTATHREVTDTTSDTSFLNRGDYVIASYDGTQVWEGIVRQVDTSVETDTGYAVKRGKDNIRTISYQLSSIELLLLSRTVRWDYLPQESAYDRLSRWVHVDTSTMAESHTPQLSALVEGDDFTGYKSLLEVIREFSTATKLPVRLAPELGPNWVQVFDDSVPWTDQPLVPQVGFETGADWATDFSYENGTPSGLEVKKGDTRFIAFNPPHAVNVFGYVLPVIKLTQTFGKEYQAQLDLDAAGSGADPLAAGEVTAIVKANEAPVVAAPQGMSPLWGYNPRDFGAKGDGVTDDTAPLQKCLDAAAKVNAHVRIPAGTYLTSLPLRVSPTTMVQGEGKYSTYIQQVNADQDGIHFVYTNPQEGIALRGGLRDISVNGTRGGTGVGIYAAILNADGTIATGKPLFGGEFLNVMVRYFSSHGFWFRGFFGSVVSHCDSWENGGHGFFFDGGTIGLDGYGTYQTSTRVDTCYANACDGWGYYATKQQYSTYQNTSCDSCTEGAYYLRDCTAIAFLACGAESTEATLVTSGDPNEVGLPDPDYRPMPYGWKIVASVGGGTTGITFTSCWNYGLTKTGWWFAPDDVTTDQNFTVQATMTDCTNLTITNVAAEFVAVVRVEKNADVTFINNKFRPAPETNRAKIVSLSADSLTMFIGTNGYGNEPGGISRTLTSPRLYPYTDSVQAINPYTQNTTTPFAITGGNPALVPFAAIGMPGQTAPVLEAIVAAQTGDAQTVFVAAPEYTIVRPTSGHAALFDVQDAATNSLFTVQQGSGVTISPRAVALRIPIYNSASAAYAAVSSGTRHGALILVDSVSANGTTDDVGLHLCLGIGDSFYAMPNGYPPI